MRKRFGERAKVFPFEWTGANSHAARREASEKLRKELESRLENHGAARYYLICHSHGGNVAMRALGGSGFQPMVCTHVVPLMLAAHPQVPARTVPELIGWIKQNHEKAVYAHSGNGSSLHMAAELFMSMSGTKMQGIPYKGSSAAHPDLLGGRVAMIFDAITGSSWH